MAKNMGEWPSEHGQITKIRLSDGCARDTVPLALERWYDFHGFGSHLGNVGQCGHGGIVHRIFTIGNVYASVIGAQYDLRYTRRQPPQGGSP